MSATLAATEDILIIETPERVPLHFGLASIGNRFIACAIDHAIQTFALILIFLGFLLLADTTNLGSAFSTAPKWVYAVMIIVLFLILTGYFAFFEWLWSGQTPGKRWLKLRVIREDGRPITFWEASVRNLIRSFDMMPAPFYSIGLISVFSTTRDQRVGDMVAGGVVGTWRMFRDNGWLGESRCQFFTKFAPPMILRPSRMKASSKNCCIAISPRIDLLSEVH